MDIMNVYNSITDIDLQFTDIQNPRSCMDIHDSMTRSPVSCARKAADGEDLQLGYVVRSVTIEFSPNRQCRTGLSYSRVPTPARSVTDWCVSKLFCAG